MRRDRARRPTSVVSGCRERWPLPVRGVAARGGVPAPSNEDVTPLHFAVRRNATGVPIVLLACGAAVDPCNLAGDTPLHRAAPGDPLEATVPLATGADVDGRANDDAAP